MVAHSRLRLRQPEVWQVEPKSERSAQASLMISPGEGEDKREIVGAGQAEEQLRRRTLNHDISGEMNQQKDAA
jgi:hypothetical protein